MFFKKKKPEVGVIAEAIINSWATHADKWKSDNFCIFIGSNSREEAPIRIWIANKDYGLKMAGTFAFGFSEIERKHLWEKFQEWTFRTSFIDKFLAALKKAEQATE